MHLWRETCRTPPRSTIEPIPSRYRHWKLSFDGEVATLAMEVAEDGGIRPGYKLKLNSYDLGVDIELHDALQRIRFEHPEVRTVVVTGARDRVFCSGANIFMLGLLARVESQFLQVHERDAQRHRGLEPHSGLKFIAAVNGACAGGGYELALACDEILLIDDRSSAVSLPEVPLLGVLPGTGGLTRLTDKRKVRHDLADIFCTTTEGVRGQRAKDWRLVDEIARPAVFATVVNRRARARRGSDRPASARRGAVGTRTPRGTRLSLEPRRRAIDRGGGSRRYGNAPEPRATADIAGILAAGADWWPLRWRASSTMRSCRCARTSSRSAPGCCRRRATPSSARVRRGARCDTGRTGSCARRSACCGAHSHDSTSRRARCSR